MKESELQEGDIIFFINHYKDEEGNISHEYVDHVGMFAGYSEEGYPLIIHSVSSKSSYYEAGSLSGLCVSTLKAVKNQVQIEDGFPDQIYDVSFHVLRIKDNPALAKKALSVLQEQANYRIPYDELRLEKMLEREDRLSEQEYKELSERYYRARGFFQSIKYAARHPSPLVRVKVDGIGHGFTCIMAVILAYQIAELLEKNLVTSIADSPDTWVSDKYGPPATDTLPTIYSAYLAKLRKTSSRTDANTSLSYSFWNGTDRTLEEFSHKTFAVDAKNISTAALLLYMTENPVWEDLGALEVCTREFTPRAKERERDRRKTVFVDALRRLEEEAKHRPSLHSPTSSTSPYALSVLASLSPPTLFSPPGTPWFTAARATLVPDDGFRLPSPASIGIHGEAAAGAGKEGTLDDSSILLLSLLRRG